MNNHVNQGHIPPCPEGGYTHQQVKAIKLFWKRRKQWYNLVPGLLAVGATSAEIRWVNYHKEIRPKPKWQISGKKGRYYDKQRLHNFLRHIRFIKSRIAAGRITVKQAIE
jgi:hypothetical protein